ncbi:MAG: flippase [Woeseiaceae bacterium]
MGSLVLRVASLGLGFVVTVVLARVLGVEGFGVYSYVLALISLLVIPAKFGLPSLVVREVASAQVAEDWGRLRGVIRWSNMMAAGFALTLTVVGGGLALAFAEKFQNGKLATFAWGLVLVPLMVLGDLRGAALRGLHHVVQGQLPEHVLRPGFLIILCGIFSLLAAGQLGPDQAMVLHAVAALLAFGIGAFLFLRVRPSALRFARPTYRRAAWIYAAVPLALAGSMQVLIRYTDIVMLGFFRGAADVGIYRAVAQTSTLVGLGLTAITLVVAPQFSALYARGDLAQLQRLATSSSGITLILAVPVAAIMIILGEDLLRLLFGAPFSAGYLPLSLLVLGQLVNAAFGSVVALLNMTGHESKAARGAAIAAAVNVVLNLLLIPRFGAAGAAAATSITITLWNIILWLEVRSHLGIDSAAIPLTRKRLGG